MKRAQKVNYSPNKISTESPFAELDTVTVLMPLPFQGGQVNKKAHVKNLDYLLNNNFLDDGRQRVIGIGGTSLIHHLDWDSLFEVVKSTSQIIGNQALLMAGVIPTPISQAKAFIEQCLQLKRCPDYFLLMPVPGLNNPDGIEIELRALTEGFGKKYGARFVLYLRNSYLKTAYTKLAQTCEYIAGIKVGTHPKDVKELFANTPSSKRVLWGVGDRATNAARQGALGHTSGLTLICPRLCDEINNAYRRQDMQASEQLEQQLAALEEIRFMEDRIYNYSAILTAAQLGGFQDIDLGEGGPFNSPPPPKIVEQISACVETLKHYH